MIPRLIAASLAVALAPLAAQDDGRRLYLSQCALCHGMDGSGGRGPSLNGPRLVHATDDDALYRVIRYGISGTEMPGTWLSPEKIRAVGRYVRTLGRVEQPALPGDAARGRTVYNQSGCSSCHTIGGRGGALGPDLNTIGAGRSVDHLRQSLLSPSAHITPGYATVRATPSAGGAIVGVVASEGTFSIQFRDPAGRVHSYWKTELTAIERSAQRSLMPPYTGNRIDDLLAFLAGLGGAE